MVCPSCKQPYYFINPLDTTRCRCRRCAAEGDFVQPSYEGYHQDLYLSTPYSRTVQTDPQMRRILNALQVRPTDRVIELGCGVGDYTKEIAQRTESVTGVDLNVDGARKRYPDVQFLAADSNKPLPFSDASADVVLSINTIEHLRDPDQFLREVARILKPQGRVALTTANLDFFLHGRFFDKTHLHEWTLPEFRALVSRTFAPAFVEKSSSMFKYHPANKVLTLFLKPDLTFVGLKAASSGT